MARVTVDDGVSLNYRTLGNGPKYVVFVHGWSMSGAVWNDLLEVFDHAGYTLLVPDLRGSGESEKPAKGYAIERYAKDVLAVADHAGAKEFGLVGHSMGGQIAQLVAATAPSRVKGLALVNAVPASGLPLPPDAAGLFRTSGGDRGKTQMILGMATKQLSPEGLERLLADSATVTAECTAQAFDAWTGASFAEKLAAITAPTLVLATDDGFLPVPFLRDAIVSKIPKARLAYLPGPGHYPQVERPKETAAILTAFVAGLG